MADMPGDRVSWTAPPTPEDDTALAICHEMAETVQDFVRTVEGVAAGRHASEAISLLLLQCAHLAVHGARLGALTDVVPEGRYEPDSGREPEVDALRVGLVRVFGEADRFRTVDDPYFQPAEVVESTLSDDLALTVADLLHGLAHYAAGRYVEALWWWQYAYLSSWGESVLNAQAALRSLISHVRLDLEHRVV